MAEFFQGHIPFSRNFTHAGKLFGGDRTIIETSFAMVDDLHEHLGQLIAYARMNGIVGSDDVRNAGMASTPPMSASAQARITSA